MRIYSNKSLLFINGDERVKVKNFEMTDVPDWVEDTPLFELAKSDGTLTVIESREQQVAAENGDLKNKGKNKNKEKGSNNESEETKTDEKSK
ncbi:TPA: hypothetical protein ACXDAY_003470 [Clostridium botulinum]|uniref:hypothetical protein n=1 Tax=Clostridium botulinum TaxID=1491 RepID=UPI00035BA375|nr:hypothetical protein [Clostridium botulinum]EPS56765.1 hypothetical protein CLQ_01751 [Clostridium botulinum Af84]MBN3360183.1 hypothetical protein [Clostridium botulinum]NFM82661.1 hypothetical protein [Clostridium botulinum]NFP12287.1 hypothetical protein [Clostridium botulinum]NFR29747.1 hypothetical protein [Clostridium botulinum]